MQDRAGDVQAEVLRAYTVLCSLRPALDSPAWAGALVINVELGAKGAAISMAANMAGAVCLTIEPNALLLRNALRTGSCDFVVNTLDEALRVVKNELRKRRPLSVGLEGDPSALLDNMMERGVAPELFTAPTAYPKAAEHFYSLGALIVGFEDEAAEAAMKIPTAANILEDFLSTHDWQLRSFAFATPVELRAFGSRALSALPAQDGLRRQWLLAAARIFPHERRRALWLTDEENQTLQAPPA